MHEFAFDAAGGVGEDDGFHAHAREDADGKRDLFGGIAFVEMDAALHSGDGNFADCADDELACVADGGGVWEMRDFRVGDFGCVVEFVGESTEARAEDQRDFGAEIGFGKNEICGGFGAFEFGVGWLFWVRFSLWAHAVVGILP